MKQDIQYNISIETIYKHIYQYDKFYNLTQFLKNSYKKRHKRRHKYDSRLLQCKKSIHDRPKVVDLNQRIGDWEADTIVGAEHTRYILTYIDRASKYLKACFIRNKSAITVAEATKELFYDSYFMM